jgi:hypothetical protein
MRLLTRLDFDGLGCAALLTEVGVLTDIRFVRPADLRHGDVPVAPNDILANVPYVRGCGLWFDHRAGERRRTAGDCFLGASVPDAPSAARVVYDFYSGEQGFANVHLRALVAAVDKAESADFTAEEVLNPGGWVLLSFLVDPRTGLAEQDGYRIGHEQLVRDLIDCCRTLPPEEILRLPDVWERVRGYFEQDRPFRRMIQANAALRGNAVVLDLRTEGRIYSGNRFLIYSLYPMQNISIQVMRARRPQDVLLICGHSIINRSSDIDVGSLMRNYGGQGHRRAGTCQVPADRADRVLTELIDHVNAPTPRPAAAQVA